MRTRLVWAAAFALLAACGSGGRTVTVAPATTTARTGLSVDDLSPVIAALDATAPDAEFTEINIQPALVNLFVAGDGDTERAFVWRNGKLDPPPDATPRLPGAVVFGVEDVDLAAPKAIRSELDRSLPQSQLVGLTLAVDPTLGLWWSASMLGEQGGGFIVSFTPAGTLIGAMPAG